MNVTVLLGGNLRKEATAGPQERTVPLPEDSRVEDLLEVLELPSPRIGMILLNGRGSLPGAELSDGDRVGLFPPELRYNTFVSLSFRREMVEARQSRSAPTQTGERNSDEH